jgi:hypothetical protein
MCVCVCVCLYIYEKGEAIRKYRLLQKNFKVYAGYNYAKEFKIQGAGIGWICSWNGEEELLSNSFSAYILWEKTPQMIT